MTRLAIIAAGGDSRRTGLSEYTTKAALPLIGRSLLSHQLDFLRQSQVQRVFVICRPAHARLLGSLLSPEDRQTTAFVLSDCATGWAGEIERAMAFVEPDDEVLLISCDNLHEKPVARWLDPETDTVFTYTNWNRADQSPTSGPVLARVTTAWGHPESQTWMQKPGMGFTGDLFTGYAVVRGQVLKAGLRDLPFSDRGEKEFTALLATLSKSPRCRAVPYPGTYEDVADLRALAFLDARMRDGVVETEADPIGACVLLHDDLNRVLLAERSDDRGWAPPGGDLEPGETYAQAAVRETAEEAGVFLDVKELRLLGVYPTRGKTGKPTCTVMFHARFGSREEPYPASFEIREVRWFGHEEVGGAIIIPFDLGEAVKDFFDGKELDAR